jgi:hypothetical protein
MVWLAFFLGCLVGSAVAVVGLGLLFAAKGDSEPPPERVKASRTPAFKS